MLGHDSNPNRQMPLVRVSARPGRGVGDVGPGLDSYRRGAIGCAGDLLVMTTIPLSPDRVRALCAKLGYTTRKSNPGEMDQLLRHKPKTETIFNSKRPTGGMCACGQWGTHRFNGSAWECETCWQRRRHRKGKVL